MKRAVLALRIFGGMQGALAVLGVVLAVMRTRAEKAIEEATTIDVVTIAAAFKRIALVWQVGHGVGLVVSVAAIGLLAASLPKGTARAIALAALGATLIYGGLVMRDWLRTEPIDVESTATRVMWLLADVAADLGLVLPLVAAGRATRGRGGAWIGIAAALAVVECLVVAYGNFAKERPHALYLISICADLALTASTALGAWGIARQLSRADDPSIASSGGEVLDGGPMRTLGWALLVRVGVGVVITVATVVCISSKDYSTAGVALALGAMGSIGASIVAVVGLTGYLRMPVERRSTEAIVFTLVAVALSAVADVWSALAANQLFGMIESASKATSFWSMPSLSDMEQLQSTLTWAGRGATVLGLAATVVLVSSLRKTARFLGDRPLDAAGNNLVFLVVAVGACALWVSIAASGESSGTIYLAGPIALLLAITLLRQWIKLLFGLADALDRRAVPGPAPAPAPRPAPAPAPAPEDGPAPERSPPE